MALQPATELGAYKILNPLGAGGMGEVYRATNARINQYDVTADGQRLLVNTSVDQKVSSPINLIINWTADVKK